MKMIFLFDSYIFGQGVCFCPQNRTWRITYHSKNVCDLIVRRLTDKYNMQCEYKFEENSHRVVIKINNDHFWLV